MADLWAWLFKEIWRKSTTAQRTPSNCQVCVMLRRYWYWILSLAEFNVWTTFVLQTRNYNLEIISISLSSNRFSILYLGSNVHRDTSPALLVQLIFVLLNEAVCSLKVHRDVQNISCTNVSPRVWRPLLNWPSYICMCIYSIPFITKYIQHARGIFLCFTCWQGIWITSHLKVVLHQSLPVAKDTDLLRN